MTNKLPAYSNTTIVWIHGLNASHHSFGYLIQVLPEHDHVLVDYNSHQSLSKSLDQVRAKLPKGQLILAGHSLGGVIAVLLAAEDPNRVKRLVTISSPFRGSRAAAALHWFPGSLPILADITPRGAFSAKITSLQLEVPTLNIISTGGHLPTSLEPNDSVVSISSQQALKFGKKVEIKLNHFEVLMSEKTADLISDFIFAEGLPYADHLAAWA